MGAMKNVLKQSKKAQVLLFVIFLILILAILAGGLGLMWESGLFTHSLVKGDLKCFYVAQAGIERAKAEFANLNWGFTGGKESFDGGNYTVSVVSFTCPKKGKEYKGKEYDECRRITSTGNIGSTEKKIVIEVGFELKDGQIQDKKILSYKEE